MSAARAKDASFSDEVAFLFIISVKLTNCIQKETREFRIMTVKSNAREKLINFLA